MSSIRVVDNRARALVRGGRQLQSLWPAASCPVPNAVPPKAGRYTIRAIARQLDNPHLYIGAQTPNPCPDSLSLASASDR